jgi:hypothetical protein
MRAPALGADGAIVWTCFTCFSPVADGAGYVGIRPADIQTPDTWADAWHVAHYEHTAAGDELNLGLGADYQIEVERIRTPMQMLAWTAHLAEKRWVSDTNWSNLVRAVAGGVS